MQSVNNLVVTGGSVSCRNRRATLRVQWNSGPKPWLPAHRCLCLCLCLCLPRLPLFSPRPCVSFRFATLPFLPHTQAGGLSVFLHVDRMAAITGARTTVGLPDAGAFRVVVSTKPHVFMYAHKLGLLPYTPRRVVVISSSQKPSNPSSAAAFAAVPFRTRAAARGATLSASTTRRVPCRPRVCVLSRTRTRSRHLQASHVPRRCGPRCGPARSSTGGGRGMAVRGGASR